MKLPHLARIATYAFVAMSSLMSLATVAPVLAVSSGGIGGRPANVDPNNPRTQSIFIYTLDKSDSKTDQVLVSNNSDTTQTINLYAVDGVVSNSGSYTCQQNSESNTGVGAWTKLSESTVTLAARENKKIDFTVKVPSTADVGEHNGCLVFQSADDQGEVKGNVRIRTRQGLRLVVTVPGNLYRDVTVGSFTAGSKNGLEQYELQINNKGNVSADVDAQMTIKSLFGKEVYKNGGVYPVLSNKQLSLNFVNENKPFFGGWYTAQASITYDSRAGTFGTSDSKFLTTKYANDITIFIAPDPLATFIYLILIIIVIGAIVFMARRSARRKRTKATWTSLIVKEGDTLGSLAAQHDVNWKKIAAVNKLKAPYTVKPGDTLLLPVSEEQTSTTDITKEV